mgnify:CR=1 FL=1
MEIKGIIFDYGGVFSDGASLTPFFNDYSKVYTADPKNFKYPIDTEQHARAAWSYIHQARNRKGYSASELKSMESRIRKALEKYNVNIEEEEDAH